MKLLRYEHSGDTHLGVLTGTGIAPLDGLSGRYPTMQSIAAGGPAALEAVRRQVDSEPTRVPLDAVRLLAPIERPGKYLAIGMNYKKHAEEAARLGVATPTQQLWFNKQTTCVAGPYDAIEPGVTEKLDYEVELGVVIGLPTKHVSEAQAPAHVFGYLVANDVSARDWQFHSPTFTMGKSFDTHGPIGPWIVTADEIADPHALGVRCFINGEPRQASDTSQLIHNVWKQIAYLSTAFTLESGDILATGTPEGVGVGMDPPRFLQPGDVVRCEVDGIGAIENKVAARV
ncbi:fumarylacetoacetate hydrolase family protein [Caulobacter sp. S45]|uniref:fumarylacetoacetate hydrolase family protein n=1 Tax=Caulobacter sp. S45 TaxID=1641861 RepID=UPI0015776D4A|nr:fumarylacetoacetate hydrolase family protein [Caulobacter sp. S45]